MCTSEEGKERLIHYVNNQLVQTSFLITSLKSSRFLATPQMPLSQRRPAYNKAAIPPTTPATAPITSIPVGAAAPPVEVLEPGAGADALGEPEPDPEATLAAADPEAPALLPVVGAAVALPLPDPEADALAGTVAGAVTLGAAESGPPVATPSLIARLRSKLQTLK